MDPLTLALEIALFIWALVVLRKHGWRTERPGLVWTMTAGALLTNALLYIIILPLLEDEAAKQNLSTAAVYGFFIFRTVEWAVLAHVMTRLALVLKRRNDLGAGFAYLQPEWKLSRTVLIGIGAGVLASVVGFVMVKLWVAVGILERPIWMELIEAGVTWEAGFAGGIRNLFSEEVVTRLGVQTLLLYHFRRYRWAPWAALVLSCLFFEVWHSGGTDFYFINFAASLSFAWSFNRDGYEAAALGHCVADWIALALPLLLLSSSP